MFLRQCSALVEVLLGCGGRGEFGSVVAQCEAKPGFLVSRKSYQALNLCLREVPVCLVSRKGFQVVSFLPSVFERFQSVWSVGSVVKSGPFNYQLRE